MIKKIILAIAVLALGLMVGNGIAVAEDQEGQIGQYSSRTETGPDGKVVTYHEWAPPQGQFCRGWWIVGANGPGGTPDGFGFIEEDVFSPVLGGFITPNPRPKFLEPAPANGFRAWTATRRWPPGYYVLGVGIVDVDGNAYWEPHNATLITWLHCTSG